VIGPDRERSLAVAVGAVSAAIIAFQLVVMQLLAVAQWHHFAYMVISMALLGFGAAGSAVVLWRGWFVRAYPVVLPLLCLATGVAMAASVWLAGWFGRFDAYLLFFDATQIGWLLGAYAVYALPFVCGGLALTLVFDREVGRIGTLYFASLTGSAAGAVGVIGALWWLAPAPLAGALALMPVAAGALLRPPGLAARQTIGIGLAALGVPLAAIVVPAEPQPSQYKPIHAALLLPDARVVFRSHGPYGQLEVVRAPALRFAPGLSLRYPDEPPVRDVVFVNGQTYGTLLGRAEAGAGHVLDYSTQGLPYAIRQPASVLVLDAATGVDVSHALSHAVARVTAVEPNAQANRLLRDLHPEWIDGLYRDPAVHLVGASVRSHLGSDDGERHDLIVLPVLGAFGGSTGTQALQERYELTLQAFDAIWQRLSDDGMIVLTVWDDQPPRLTLRALATVRAALARQGVDDAQANLAAIRSWGTVSLVLTRRAWSVQDIERIRGFAAERGFDPLVLPGLDRGERDRFNRVSDRAWLDAVDTLVAGDPAALLERYPFDLRPTRDDRPFFEHFMRAAGLRQLLASYGARELPYLELGFVFGLVTFVQIVLAALLLIVLPLLRVGWRGTRRRWTLLYFAGTGVGFMAFEIVLMQWLVLYLGHPIYAAAAVLTALLLGAGLGSWASSRLPATPRVLVVAAAAIFALIVLYARLLTPALDASMGWPLPAKAVAVLGLLAPPALLMGMLFPLGLRRLAGSDDTHVAWACGIDHSLSVAATAGATLLALEAGFGAVMLVAALAYAAVAVAGTRLGQGV
jgi:hypothetical protein